MTGGKCGYCGVELSPYHRKKNGFTIDHIVPHHKTQDDSIENLLPCCNKCNKLKSTYHVEEFREILKDELREGTVYLYESSRRYADLYEDNIHEEILPHLNKICEIINNKELEFYAEKLGWTVPTSS